jgi:hypothetical protein
VTSALVAVLPYPVTIEERNLSKRREERKEGTNKSVIPPIPHSALHPLLKMTPVCCLKAQTPMLPRVASGLKGRTRTCPRRSFPRPPRRRNAQKRVNFQVWTP